MNLGAEKVIWQENRCMLYQRAAKEFSRMSLVRGNIYFQIVILEGCNFFFTLTKSSHCLSWSEARFVWARSNGKPSVGNLVRHTCDQISLSLQSAVTRPSEQPCWVMHGSSFSCWVLFVLIPCYLFFLVIYPSTLLSVTELCFNVGAQFAWLEIGRRGEWMDTSGSFPCCRQLTSCPNHRYPLAAPGSSGALEPTAANPGFLF